MGLNYDLDSMRKAIDQCDVNIKTFEDAIAKELDTQQYYKGIVRKLEAEERTKVDGTDS